MTKSISDGTMSVMVEASPVVIVMGSRDVLSDISPDRRRISEAHIELDDSRFDNNLNPNIDIDLSRSPSVGETFVSAATDGPLSSSDSSDTDSSDDEVDQLGGKTLRSPSLNSNHNSATAFDHLSSLPLEIRPLSPGEGPSGSTSISMSIGSAGKCCSIATGFKLMPHVHVYRLFCMKCMQQHYIRVGKSRFDRLTAISNKSL